MADKQGDKFTKQLSNGISAIGAKKADTYNGADMRAAGIIHSVLGVIVGSVVARKRAAAGDQPVAKLFF